MEDFHSGAGDAEAEAAISRPRQDQAPGEMFACSGLGPEALAQLEQLIRHVELTKGETAVREGEGDPGLLTVVKGVLKLSKQLHDGRRQITGFRFPGDLLTWSQPGQSAVISVQAVTDAVLCHIDSRQFREFSAAHPAIGGHLQDLAAEEFAKLQAHMLTLGRKTPVEKLATFLLEMLQCSNGIGQGDGLVTLPMTRNDIADYIGLETETTSRIFTRLKEEGILSLPRPNRVLVQDRSALERLAAGDGIGAAIKPPKAACGS